MHRIKNLPAIFIMLLLSACIKPYSPVIDGNAQKKYVVSGRVTDQEGWQEVEVSRSSPVGSPDYVPVRGCQAKIEDDHGHDFPLTETEPGLYRGWMGQADLSPGISYRVQVITPEGETIRSGFDKMPAGPPFVSVSYFLKDVPTTDPGTTLQVVQFYVDLNAVGNYSQYYKWEVEETWEYHAAHPAEYYYDGDFHHIQPPDYSNKVCWITLPVKNVFTVSTIGLAENIYKEYPLQAVGANTSRLIILYSMLVRQLALSDGAYNYWEQLRINSNEQGGLYGKQPLAIKGNMQNMSAPDKDVLGYFYAASVSSRRYFFQDIPGFEITYNDYCAGEPLGLMGWREFYPSEYPVYYYFNEGGALRTLSHECVDCRLGGGITVKPDFWPY